MLRGSACTDAVEPKSFGVSVNCCIDGQQAPQHLPLFPIVSSLICMSYPSFRAAILPGGVILLKTEEFGKYCRVS